MRYLYLLLTSILIYSCATHFEGFRGDYQDGPYEIATSKSFESVWSELIDLFATEGFPIHILDKNSGLIVTDKQILPSTVEKNGKLVNPRAYVVSNNLKIWGKDYGSTRITAQWNVRVKTIGSNTLVSVNIINLEHVTETQGDKFGVVSTGVFERKVSNIITGGAANTTLSIANNTPENNPVDINEEITSKSNNAVPAEKSNKDLSIGIERQSFEALRDKTLNELNLRREDLNARESELDTRQSRIDQKERELLKREQKISQATKERSSKPQAPPPATYTAPAQVKPSPAAKMRYVQFVATTAGRSYSDVAHLGTVISEKVPGKNIYRYKLKGSWSDAQVQTVVSRLSSLGYKGAFESK